VGYLFSARNGFHSSVHCFGFRFFLKMTLRKEKNMKSVAYGPWPKASKRPPRRRRSDISRHASARRCASFAKNEPNIWFLARRRCSICAASWHFVAIFPLRLANTRQGIANKHVNDSAAAITGGDKNGASRLFANFTDDASFGTAGHRTKRA